MPGGDRLEGAARRRLVHGAALGQGVARQTPAEVVVEDLDLTRRVEHDRVAGPRVPRHVRSQAAVVVARQVWVAPLRGDPWEPPRDQRDEQERSRHGAQRTAPPRDQRADPDDSGRGQEVDRWRDKQHELRMEEGAAQRDDEHRSQWDERVGDEEPPRARYPPRDDDAGDHRDREWQAHQWRGAVAALADGEQPERPDDEVGEPERLTRGWPTGELTHRSDDPGHEEQRTGRRRGEERTEQSEPSRWVAQPPETDADPVGKWNRGREVVAVQRRGERDRVGAPETNAGPPQRAQEQRGAGGGERGRLRVHPRLLAVPDRQRRA